MITKYVVGLVFNEDESEILLINKLRPSWQKGLYNGIGGKVELVKKVGRKKIYETPEESISRECYEECNLEIPPENWKYFCKISYITKKDRSIDKQIVYFLKTSVDINNFRSNTDEIIEKFYINNIPNNLVDKLSFMLSIHKENRLYEVKVFCN